MTLLAMFSDKGSPGVTTAALALATVWPRRVALVELDPAGGDLALRLVDAAGCPVLEPAPNLLTLAAAARRGSTAPSSPMWEHGQPLPTSTTASVIVGLAAPEQASGMSELWPHVVSAAATVDGGDTIADLGRIADATSTRLLVEQADVLIGVARAEPAAMLRMRDRMRHVVDSLSPAPLRRTYVVLVAEDRRAHEAAAAMERVLLDGALPVRVAGAIALDLCALDLLHSGQNGPRLDRSLLLRSARTVAAVLGGGTYSALPSPSRRLLARSR